MKPSAKSQPDVSPLTKRDDTLAKASGQVLTSRSQMTRRRKDQALMWRTALVIGFAIVAVFVGLEVLQTKPKKPEIFAARLEVERKASAAPESFDVAATVPSTKEQAVPLPQAAPDSSPPAITPVIPETGEANPSEADRLAAEPVICLTGLDSQRDAARNRDRELLKRAIEGQAWDAYRALLGKSVKAGLNRIAPGQGVNRFDALWKEPSLYQALLRWKTLGCFSESEISAHTKDTYSAGVLIWLLGNNQAMEEFLLTIQPKDDAGKILKFLMDVWSGDPDYFQKYFPLALACAVVFDETMTIPNPVGKAEYGVESVVDPLGRFRWYIEKNEKGKLAVPVHHSSARDLVWVVSAPVTTSEMEWALDKMHHHRKNWGDAYDEVEYLMERAVNGLNPYKEYSFAEILKEGGICGDRSYFCAYTARAQGIPAMIIGGETDLGGHEWVGMKIDSDEWTTAIGRIGGVSKGQTVNPQTRETVTEQEILLWNDRYHRSQAITLSVWRHLWLADYFSAMGNGDENGATIRLANQLGPTFTETWKALYSLLERQTQLTGDPAKPNNLEEWKSFAKGMRREFKDNPRMAELAANAESEYIFPYGPEGDATRSLQRERHRIERDSGEQTDLIAASLKRQAELINKRGGAEAKRDISRLYDRALRDYGGSITGFKMMAGDYFGYLKDDPELGRKAVRDIELAFKRVVETGTAEWFRANTESSIYKMICGYYRAVGDSERADMLEKRQEVLLKRAKRGAL